MSAADGCDVVRILDKSGQPVRRSWRVGLQVVLPDGSPCLGVAIVRAETATHAANACRRMPGGCVIFDIEEVPAS